MKKVLCIAAALAALTTALPAAACGDMCVDGGVTDKVFVGGNATFGGFGATQFTGAEGLGEVSKAGYSFVETIVNAGGSLCGADCQDGTFTFKGAAGERVDAVGWAKGTTSGETVSVTNQGGAFSGVTFQFGKMGLQPAQ
ncbi:MAG: hypothetical protein RL097_131 [Candidatus Parcubacteria bacterium]|jgi:hypothetical protein